MPTFSERDLVAGRYRLDSVLGEGGMGTVWTGRDQLLGRTVAVKEVRIPPGLPERDREVLHKRMMREARLTARLNDPRVITVYDVVLHDDRPYIVMELVPSRSLDQVLDSTGPLPPQRVAQVGLELLAALDLAHREGIVHRDVKPSNVLLADNGRVVLTDFGIATTESDATLTSTGLLVGSPTYMSPERLRGEDAGPPADVWSLGATLYAALEAHPPFRAATTMGTITSILTDEVQPPRSAPPALVNALLGMLRREPAQRLTSPQVLKLLQQAASQRGGATTTVPAPAPVMAPVVALVGWHSNGSEASALGHPYEAAYESPDDPPPMGPAAGSAPEYVWESEADQPQTHESVRADRSGGHSHTMALIIGFALLAVVLGGVVGVYLNRSAGGATSGTGGQTNAAGSTQDEPTTDSPSSDATTPDMTAPTIDPTEQDGEAGQDDDGGNEDAAKPPSGYDLVTDPLSFQVAVPKGWQRLQNTKTAIFFRSPDGTQYLRIEQVAEAESAVQDWAVQEADLKKRVSGYQRIRLEPVNYRWDAADWEFTFEASIGTTHVLSRAFITDPRGFSIYMSAPESIWASEALPVFQAAADTFQPSD